MSVQNENMVYDPEFFIQLKIVYWGPGESGKTTNYEQLLLQLKDYIVSKPMQINTTDKRTLWSDSVTMKVPFELRSKKITLSIQVTTATGQERFLSTREYVITGADGVIFVADSNPNKVDQNIRSFKELTAFVNNRKIPFLVQLNKRDLVNAIPKNEFKEHLGLPDEEIDEHGFRFIYYSEAINGINVKEIFRELLSKILVIKYIDGEL